MNGLCRHFCCVASLAVLGFATNVVAQSPQSDLPPAAPPVTETTATTAISAQVQDGTPIEDVQLRIVGRQATSAKLVKKSLRSKAGTEFSQETFANDIQRIKNYEVFQSVSGTTYLSGNAVTLDVVVEDRWTIIPVFRPSVGAGIKIIKLGYRDSNFLGRNHNLVLFAGPYLSKTKNSYVAGFESNVRQFAGKHALDSFGGRDFFVDFYYDYATGGSVSDIQVDTLQGESTFWLQRFDFAPVPFSPGIGLFLYQRKYTQLNGIAPPDGLAQTSSAIRPKLALKVGRVDFEAYRYEGYDFQIAGFRQFSLQGADTPGFWGGEFEGRYFTRPHPRLNFAVRARVDIRNNKHTLDDVLYGGLDRIRGFPASWIRGQRAGLLNNEMRVLIHENAWDWLFVQGVLLYDVGVAGRDGSARVAQSIGLGTRLAVIPVFGMFSRIDVARSLTDGSLSFDVNIGIKEFF